jgi:hypothetical protein
MKRKAEKWDVKACLVKGAVPKNRPCDWCGKKVNRGFIHKACAEKERDAWFDILY